MMKKFLIVDDSELFRRGIRSILEQDEQAKIQEASCSSGLFNILNEGAFFPELIFLDVRLKKASSLSGIEIAQQLRKDYPQIKIVIITANDEARVLKQAMEAEVDGFLPKESIADEIRECLQSLSEGNNYLGKSIPFTHIQTAFRKTDRMVDLLTPTEKKVFILLAKSYLNKEIADKLCVSTHTIETHKSNIKNKLGIKSDVDFLALAIKDEVPEVLAHIGM